MQKKKEIFKDFPGNVYAVSSATSPQHKALKEKIKVDVTLLSDPNLVLINKAGMKNPDYKEAFRGFAILDKSGNVVEKYQVDNFGERAEEIVTYAKDKISVLK